jgi:hypothetical protein
MIATVSGNAAAGPPSKTIMWVRGAARAAVGMLALMLALLTASVAGNRAKAIVITGPESTDSTYVTHLIAHVFNVGRGLHNGFAGNIG